MYEMSEDFIKQYLEDAGITLEKIEVQGFSEYARFYFKELVHLGVFLKDVPLSDLTTKARYDILKSAYKLWKKARETGINGIITGTEIDFSASS